MNLVLTSGVDSVKPSVVSEAISLVPSGNIAPKRRGRKLTEALARQILLAEGSQRSIAKRFGVQQPCVSDIKSGRRWGWLQPEKVYTPEKLIPKVSDADIRQYDPMVQRVINDYVLRYWAPGCSCATLDQRMSIGRLGMSVEDLIQQGRIWVMEQTRWIKRCRGSRSRKIGSKLGIAKESTRMMGWLAKKFISLSRSFAVARHGGQAIGVDDYKTTLQDFLDSSEIHDSPEECAAALMEALKSSTIEARRSVSSRLFKLDGLTLKVETVEEILEIARQRLAESHVISYVDLDVAETLTACEDVTPETVAIAMEAINADVPAFEEAIRKGAPRRPKRQSVFRIFHVARQKGLPDTHGELAKHLGKSASALSQILHGESNGTPEFRERLQAIFGEPLEQLRSVFPVDMR